jgi:biotin operon repressor
LEVSAVPDNIVQFTLPKKPRIKEKEPAPDQRKLAVIPIRAATDRSLTEGMMRTLLLVASYCNRAGITWVGQARLAQDLGVSRQAITRQVGKLVKAGYLEVVSKGWRGERANSIRLIFDKSIDAETAVAITSRIEDTRTPLMKEKQMQDMTPDPEGLKRIHDMIKGAVKPVTQPAKEYQMPKSGDTVTVAKMKKEIAKKKQSKATDTLPSEVANEEPSHRQPEAVDNSVHRQPHRLHPEVALNTKNIGIDKVLRLFINKGFNVLSNQEIIEAVVEHVSAAEVETLIDRLSERYASEGLALPTDGAVLANDLITLHADQLTARHGI